MIVSRIVQTRWLFGTICLAIILTLTLSGSNCIQNKRDDTGERESDINRHTDNASVCATPEKYDYSAAITHDGLERTYHVHIGRSYNADSPTPLVIALHGGGGTGRGMERLTGFNAVADSEDFIVVYPDGIEKHWNDGRGIQKYRAHIENIDDVGFISALIGELSGEVNIDTTRVYVTGISNGGMMSHRLACELSDKITAISPVVSSVPVNMATVWEPSRSVPVLIINGTDDPLVPWEGGEIRIGMSVHGDVLSVADTVKFWTDKNDCSMLPVVTHLPDEAPTDGTSVRKEVYAECTDEVAVILYAVEGGGHTWPGGYQYLPEFIIGKTSGEFDATEVIWQFFSEHSLD